MYGYDFIEVTYPDQGVANITLSRGDEFNALLSEMYDELADAAERLSAQDDLRVAVLRGEGRAFSVGHTVERLRDLRGEEAHRSGAQEFIEAIDSMPFPLIAAIDGLALGGGLELSLHCDLRFASSRSEFALPELELGVTPGAGGLRMLANAVGAQRAREMVFTGRRIDAEEAYRIGLVCDIYDGDEFEERLEKIVNDIASKAPLALREAKRLLRQSNLDRPSAESMAEGHETFFNLLETDDADEGIQAHLEDREPRFKGQ